MNCQKIGSQFVQACIQNFKSILKKRNNSHKLCHYSQNQQIELSLYDQAKEHQTKTRNLKKALSLYSKAALNGQKVNSCIKDFASVLHQCGYTVQAINFLQEMKPSYRGDKEKYQKLIKNLTTQLKPTGKHQYKNILIDLVDFRFQVPCKQVIKMFQNSSRIREIECFQDLGLRFRSNRGRYIVLEFDSFSAAKKTLQTFKEQQWFGVNKFWMDSEFNIVAEACDGKVDFENGFLMNKGKIQKISGKDIQQFNLKIKIPKFNQLFGYQGLQLRNQVSSYLIQNFTAFTNEKQNIME